MGRRLAMSLGAFALVASEFMPVSLLTPIAGDLHVSEARLVAISVSGAFALVTSLFIASLAGRRDRKPLLLVLTLLTIVSGTLVAFAPNYAAFIAGRALIGVAIGGFWSMSAATAMRLVPAPHVPRALAIVNAAMRWRPSSRPARQLSGRNRRVALGVLLRRAGRRDRIRLEARQPAVDAVRAARRRPTRSGCWPGRRSRSAWRR